MAKAELSPDGGRRRRLRNETTLFTITVSLLILFRVIIGYQPHSGQDNYHGSHNAYGGDFEAQRHWMELTIHLPIGEWYWYDLSYWGLDYPPLSAYLSWICGWLSHFLVGPESVALETSRGFEDPTHKSFMRATVIAMDMTVYGTAVWFWTVKRKGWTDRQLWNFVLAMMQPALLLIDHGHFQYNTVSLGFSLWAFLLVTGDNFRWCICASICFCLALSFKQMTLYYAPAIFFYLLGRCLQEKQKFLPRLLMLGCTVVIVMSALWWPFVAFGPQDTTIIERTIHVFRRIIPLQRGIFEGKVANLWCALSTKPVRIKERISAELLPLAASLATILLVSPACYRLFTLGRSKQRTSDEAYILLYGMMASALSFFLASFQVHEKSILMAVAPASLLLDEDFDFVYWFSIAATWTLWPLLVLDRLQVAYMGTLVLFGQIVWMRSLFLRDNLRTTSILQQNLWLGLIPTLSWTLIGFLHILEPLVTLPETLPDLFPVLWSIVGCGFCCLAWIISIWKLFSKLKVS